MGGVSLMLIGYGVFNFDFSRRMDLTWCHQRKELVLLTLHLLPWLPRWNLNWTLWLCWQLFSWMGFCFVLLYYVLWYNCHVFTFLFAMLHVLVIVIVDGLKGNHDKMEIIMEHSHDVFIKEEMVPNCHDHSSHENLIIIFWQQWCGNDANMNGGQYFIVVLVNSILTLILCIALCITMLLLWNKIH